MTDQQRNRQWLATATSDQIIEAQKRGELWSLLAPNAVTSEASEVEQQREEAEAGEQGGGGDLGARGERPENAIAWLEQLSDEQIVAEHRAGRLDRLLGGDA